MESRTQRLPLPKNEARLQDLVLQLLRLPTLLKLQLAPQGIEVQRGVVEGDSVVPESLVGLAKGVPPLEPDVAFMLGRLEMHELEPDPKRHPLTTLIAMFNAVREVELVPCAWYVCHGDGLDAFLGQRQGTLPAQLLGVAVTYVSELIVPEGRLVLVGSPTGYRIDSTYSVTAEIGA